MRRAWALVTAVVLFVPAGGLRAVADPKQDSSEDYSFDVKAFEKKPYEWGGFLEMKGQQLVLDQNARLPGLSATPAGSEKLLHQAWGVVELNAKASKKQVTVFSHLRGMTGAGQQGFSSHLQLLRLSLAAQPSSLLDIEVGKTTVRWGKGYAFNPVAFIDPPKDPGDPDEALEGYFLARVGLTKSFDGPLKTYSLSAVVLPVHEGLNEDFGRLGHENLGARLYLLLFDTDIDLVALTAGSRSERYGLDLARNITSNLEVHAEVAFLPDVPVPQLAAGAPPRTEKQAAVQVLGGVRYLSPHDTTYIVEYYHNTAGASSEQLRLLYELLNTPQFVGDVADATVLAPYRGPFPMRHYLYARINQKEPFGILDLFVSLFGIVNLEDGSFTATPEILYKGITNLELRLRGTMLVGMANTDFGERPNDGRVELRARYFF